MDNLINIIQNEALKNKEELLNTQNCMKCKMCDDCSYHMIHCCCDICSWLEKEGE